MWCQTVSIICNSQSLYAHIVVSAFYCPLTCVYFVDMLGGGKARSIRLMPKCSQSCWNLHTCKSVDFVMFAESLWKVFTYFLSLVKQTLTCCKNMQTTVETNTILHNQENKPVFQYIKAGIILTHLHH